MGRGSRRAKEKVREGGDHAKVLTAIAKHCMAHAERLAEPLSIKEDARTVLDALVRDPAVRGAHRDAVLINERLLANDALLHQLVRPRRSKAAQARQLAIVAMMQTLQMWNAGDEDPIFPYATPHEAAHAVAKTFKSAGLHQRLTTDGVVQTYRRFLEHFYERARNSPTPKKKRVREKHT